MKLSLGLLMIAVLLTDLVDKAIGSEPTTWMKLAFLTTGVILALAYVLVLHRLLNRRV